MVVRVGLISDTHVPEATNNLWPQVFDAFDGVDYIFHGGDVHEFWVLDKLEAIAPVYCARGNGEDGSGGRPKQPEDPRVRYSWLLNLAGISIGLTHYIPVEPTTPPDTPLQKWLDLFFDGERPEIIVFGDTHVETINHVDGILCVNPGSPTYPHNYDTQFGTIGFLELENGKAAASIVLITESGVTPFDWAATPPWKLRL